MTRRVKIGAALLLLGIITVAGISAGRDFWADWHFRSLEDAVRQGDYPRAKRHLQSCMTVWSNSWRCDLWKIRLARLTGRLDDAERLLLAAGLRQQSISRESLGLETLLLKAQQGLCNEDEEMRLRGFVDQDHPDTPLLLHALVLGYLRLYRLHDAEGCLKLWLEIQPDNVDALLQQGKVHERLTRFREAADTYREILRRKPNDDEVMIRVAYLQVLTNQITEATDHVERLLQTRRDDPRVLLAAGVYRQHQSKLDEAVQLLDELLKQEPHDVRGLLARGKIELQREQARAALPYLERALATAPKDYQALFLMAQCLQQLGKGAEGKKLQEQALLAQQDLTRLGDLTKILQQRPNDPDIRCEIGTLLISFGNEREGRIWLESALHFAPNHAGAQRALDKLGAAPARGAPR